MKRIKWLLYEIKWFIVGVLHVVSGKYYVSDKKYAGRILHTAGEGNDHIRERIASGEPFAFMRYSYTEMDVMIHSTTQQFFFIPMTRVMDWLNIFCKEGESNAQGAASYNALMGRAFKSADVIGIWQSLHMGDALMDLNETSDSLFVTEAKSVEPYYYDKPWTSSLKGKKVLVVSPFSQAIRAQYKRREEIWDNKDILPEFTLDTEDAIWYYGGQRDERFGNWFEAFDFLYERIMEHDFDVAILGCGYFGYALAAKIKEAGRQAVHMGGATQLLFGIKGKRWDNNPNVRCFYNDSWIRPEAALKPADDENLDKGCYW